MWMLVLLLQYNRCVGGCANPLASQAEAETSPGKEGGDKVAAGSGLPMTCYC